MLMKARLKGAQKGHSLLKKKADALQMRFRMILSKIIEVRRRTVQIFEKSFIIILFSDQNSNGRGDERSCVLTSRS